MGIFYHPKVSLRVYDSYRYNASEHPIPFHRAQDLGKIPKKLAGGPAPDLEEAYVRELILTWSFFLHTIADSVEQVDDVVDDISEDETKEKDSDDVTKDSLIKPTKKAKGKTKK